MVKRVLINGASGRIGKLLAYQIAQSRDLELISLNDPVGIDALVINYNKNDSTHGRFSWKVEKIDDTIITIKGSGLLEKRVKIYSEKDPKKMHMQEDGVQIVEECSGFYDGKKDNPASAFLIGGVERVVMSYPAAVKDITLISGANLELFDPKKHRLISNGSCTTKSLVTPLSILLDNKIEIYDLNMTTIHAATNTQRVLDFADDYATLNQISTHKTGAAQATSEVIESLEGKMDGMAFRVPTTDGSFSFMSIIAGYNGKLTKDSLNEVLLKHSSDTKYMGRLGFAYGNKKGEVASSDIVGRTENGIILLSKTQVKPIPLTTQNEKQVYRITLISGYDNEMGPPVDQTLVTEYIARNS